jgi:hypothetical protein
MIVMSHGTCMLIGKTAAQNFGLILMLHWQQITGSNAKS